MSSKYSIDRNDLKERLKEAREYAELTQKDLAREVGIAQSSVAGYESDNPKGSVPPLDIAVKIIQATNCNPLYVLGFSNDIENIGLSLEGKPLEQQKKSLNYDWLVDQILELDSFRSLLTYIYMAIEQESPMLDYYAHIHGVPLPVIAREAGVDKNILDDCLANEQNMLLSRQDACLYKCHYALDGIIENLTRIAKKDGFSNFDSTKKVNQYIQRMEEAEKNGKESNDQGR